MFQAKENIIKNFIDGKESAFKGIYEKYVSTLRYFGNKFLSDERLIEDILQDTFVSLWENRKKFNNELAIKSFLYTGVKNRCLNNLRHEKIKQKYVEGFVEEPSESFLENVIKAELFEMLHRIFDELPPACKEVYQLSLEGQQRIFGEILEVAAAERRTMNVQGEAIETVDIEQQRFVARHDANVIQQLRVPLAVSFQ